MSKICIFCGSKFGKPESSYQKMAQELVQNLTTLNLDLVYGGASIGLMGALADGFLKQDKKVYGVIPKGLMDREVGHEGLTELIVTKDMHERKTKMYDLSDAFLVLPGGIGTLEEMFEVLTWKGLGYHQKPIFLFDYNNFYGQLIEHFNRMQNHGFLYDSPEEIFTVARKGPELVEALKRFLPV